MPIYLHQHGTRSGESERDVVVALAQHVAKVHLAANSIAVLTDSVGGSADAGYVVAAVAPDCVNAAASGSDLADKATAEAALATVRDGFKEVVAKANAAAPKLGFSAVTDSLGGTAADGTVGAVTVSVTGAATGGVATETNATLEALAVAQAVAVGLANKVIAATGGQKLQLASAASRPYVSTLPALTVSVGTAAATGVKKAVLDAKLAQYRTNLKTIVVALNAALTANTVPPVVVT